MLTRLLLVFAYMLKTSKRYRSIKRFFFDLLENVDNPLKKIFDVFMICIIFSSVGLKVYESRTAPNLYIDWFEYEVMLLFIVEYILRAWLYNDSHLIILREYEKALYLNKPFELRAALKEILLKKLAYMTSPYALIDLLAIIPTYREIRFLRIFLIFRLFKLFRYVNSIKIFTDVIVSKRFELLTLAMIMGLIVIIATLAIYLFESPALGGEIEDLFSGFYWAIVTVATHGDARMATLRVSDCGPGFPAQILEHAFEPYVTTKPKGTGLGLAIVRKIIDDHGGTITLANRAGWLSRENFRTHRLCLDRDAGGTPMVRRRDDSDKRRHVVDPVCHDSAACPPNGSAIISAFRSSSQSNA